MRAMLATLGYAAAAALVILGAEQVSHDVYRSLYFDGGMAFDARGNPVKTPLRPIQFGQLVLEWHGLLMLVLGVLLGASAYKLRRKP